MKGKDPYFYTDDELKDAIRWGNDLDVRNELLNRGIFDSGDSIEDYGNGRCARDEENDIGDFDGGLIEFFTSSAFKLVFIGALVVGLLYVILLGTGTVVVGSIYYQWWIFSAFAIGCFFSYLGKGMNIFSTIVLYITSLGLGARLFAFVSELVLNQSFASWFMQDSTHLMDLFKGSLWFIGFMIVVPPIITVIVNFLFGFIAGMREGNRDRVIEEQVTSRM
ncbi:hypothetical protein SFC65_24350 [Priestia filamentosa]|uniref:hypothetical protein n=1 Tax=Priestia filamentosa TaxID=1402861 RepID=UPI00398261FC